MNFISELRKLGMQWARGDELPDMESPDPGAKKAAIPNYFKNMTSKLRDAQTWQEKRQGVSQYIFDADDKLKRSAAVGIENRRKTWNNPTGLVRSQEVALLSNGSGEHTCGESGCGHTYNGNLTSRLFADNGEGTPLDPEDSVAIGGHTLHFLQDHPYTEEAKTIAPQIVRLSELSLETRETQ